MKFEKSPKKSKICKGVSPWVLVKKSTFFYSGFLGKSRLKRSFFNILDTIEDIKNIEKFCQFLIKTMDYPFGKIPIFSTFLASCFYSLETLFFLSRTFSNTFSLPITPSVTQGVIMTRSNRMKFRLQAMPHAIPRTHSSSPVVNRIFAKLSVTCGREQ